MNHSITNTDKLQDILHTFANKLWEKLLDNNVQHSSQEELETIVKQHNDAMQKKDQYTNLVQRCLGAIEVLERMIKNAEKVSDK